MMVTFFQQVGIFGRQLLSISVQYDDDRQTEPCRIPIFCIHRAVVAFVYINHHDDKIGLQNIADGRVGFKKRVEFVAPTAPIRAEHQENTLMLFCGCVQRSGNLLGAIGGLVINVRTLWRSVRGRVRLCARDAASGEEQYWNDVLCFHKGVRVKLFEESSQSTESLYIAPKLGSAILPEQQNADGKPREVAAQNDKARRELVRRALINDVAKNQCCNLHPE